jgi:hypothetical protein
MAMRPLDIWYVSFENKLRPEKRAVPRSTETFRSEAEAKEFAKQVLDEAKNVTAGTLNPHLPKRVISAAQLVDWLAESGTNAPPRQ